MIEYSRFEAPLPESALTDLWYLVQVCFEPGSFESFLERVREKRRPFAVVARDGDAPVAFKLGCERYREEFYSWLGGVHPQYRRRGLARNLLLAQHDWCRQAGYALISTEALNDNRAMLVLDILHGFQIMGVRADDRGLKVLLVRRLNAQ